MQAEIFKGQTVVVSGAAGKIGRVVCLGLADAGANVVVNDVKAELVTELVEALRSKGCKALGIPLSGVEGKTIIEKTIAEFGAVHAVVNATLTSPAWKPFDEVTDDQFQTSFISNVMAPLSIIRAAWPHFQKQKYGRVVNFTSDSMLGMPTASDYTMTKGALFGVNKTLALEGMAHNIKVNCVSPIAYVPHMERHIQRFSEPIQKAFKEQYKPEANVPMILTLLSNGCTASGQVFTTAGYGAGRNVWGLQSGKKDLHTVEDCLKELEFLCDKGTRPVFEPQSMIDFTEFQATYTIPD